MDRYELRRLDYSLSDDQAMTVQVTDVLEVLHWFKSVDAGAHPGSAGTIEFRASHDTAVDRWLPNGIGDFNGDGTSDIAWYDDAIRDIDIWKLSNGAWAGSADAGVHPAGYQPAGFGDLNGDGTSDIIWFNPMLHAIEWLRSAYYESYGADMLNRGYLLGYASLTLFLGLILERGVRGKLQQLN